MNTDLLIPLLTFGGTLLLVVTGLLNFSVFVRQLRTAREQLETARRQLESARQQPQIQLVQRAMADSFPIARFPIVNLIDRQGAIGNWQSTMGNDSVVRSARFRKGIADWSKPNGSIGNRKLAIGNGNAPLCGISLCCPPYFLPAFFGRPGLRFLTSFRSFESMK